MATKLGLKTVQSDIARDVKELTALFKKSAHKYLSMRDMHTKIDDEISKLDIGRVPNGNKPFKVAFELLKVACGVLEFACEPLKSC